VIGRDPDAICCLTETEVNGVYRVEWILREFACPEAETVVWDYPLHRSAPEYSDVAVAGGRKPAVDAGDFREAVRKACGSGGEATIEAVQRELGGRGSRSTFQRLCKELKRAGVGIAVRGNRIVSPESAQAAQNVVGCAAKGQGVGLICQPTAQMPIVGLG